MEGDYGNAFKSSFQEHFTHIEPLHPPLSATSYRSNSLSLFLPPSLSSKAIYHKLSFSTEIVLAFFYQAYAQALSTHATLRYHLTKVSGRFPRGVLEGAAETAVSYTWRLLATLPTERGCSGSLNSTPTEFRSFLRQKKLGLLLPKLNQFTWLFTYVNITPLNGTNYF